MTEQKFLDTAPEGFDPTCELKWIWEWFKAAPYYDDKRLVLCQKWTGAFRDVWVRVPVEE